ncbi:Putative toxin component near putative ESAT-related protein, repetitive [Bacillus mycoides]|uniref:hypothetical protein n=1 Tax=Bacillus mycoides TaxID=1405 RepID=UPI0005C86D7F|nr:hypothetical protein [Bacillus mycoides]KIV72518.1 Putative toxin component near putative ESAT-related protein, repetitive [Bacillus mycoides]
MNKLPDSMKNVVEKIKNIEIPNLFPEPSLAGIGGERKTLGELFSVAKSETKGTGESGIPPRYGERKITDEEYEA